MILLSRHCTKVLLTLWLPKGIIKVMVPYGIYGATDLNCCTQRERLRRIPFAEVCMHSYTLPHALIP